MASSTDSEGSNSKAPENFRISSSNDGCDEDCQGKSHYRLRCPLCASLQKRFVCTTCIRKGNFIHSSHHLEESLADKQKKYFNIQASLKVYRNRYERLIKEPKAAENLQFEIKHKKDGIELLKQLIASKREEINIKQQERDTLQRFNIDKKRYLPKYPAKVAELEDHVADNRQIIAQLNEKKKNILEQLRKVTSADIKKLIDYIFPISEVVLKDEARGGKTMVIPQRSALTNVSEDSDTIAALAEAKNTHYIRGKWVLHGSGISEMQYRIVAPSLPANGDYSAYLDWLTENKDDVPKSETNEISPSRVAAFRISGALTYATQLTNLLSFYLNVRLPFKLAYGDFCKKLNEEQFMRKVSRLNTNIMYLAYTQRVKLRLLNENHTLENIITTLDPEKSELGRYGPNEETNAPLTKSIDSLLVGIETGTESESEDENSLRLDWEAVSSLPAQEIAPTIMLPPNQQTTSIAEGLMNSAVNRLTSLLKWVK